MELEVRADTTRSPWRARGENTHLMGFVDSKTLSNRDRSCRCMAKIHTGDTVTTEGLKLDVQIYENRLGDHHAINAHELGVEHLLKIPTFRVPTMDELKAELTSGKKRWKK